MSDLFEKLERLGPQLTPDWADETRALALARLHDVRHRRRRAKQAGLSVLVVCVLVGAVVALRRDSGNRSVAPPEVAQSSVAVQPDARVVVARPSKVVPAAADRPSERSGLIATFADGARIETFAGKPARIDYVDRTQVKVSLESGSHDVHIGPDSVKTYALAYGGVTLTVRRATMTLRAGPEALRIDLRQGKVRVERSGAAVTTVMGPRSWTIDLQQREVATKRARSAKSWRELARRGDYSKAHALIKRQKKLVRQTPGDLLLAADAARLSGDARAAVPFLEKLLKRFSKDPRASLAAFTLGRIELHALRRFGRAATAFSKARSLAPQGPLADEALARQAQALRRAGKLGRAMALAKRYLELHPKGRRRKAMQQLLSKARP